ncbi:HDOD domain-containing protein [Marichromatium bheemlicum]|uniref:HDOD domain-containing protein n=1 Tax=Marichromatium bheemlicum TaxID=365339 RepID=A0ABX1IAV8_9GAMM|nr:HDOD domain-containing protein [Marichromatium bheemlicum]NKN33505.1 HDOD domain-containing protein [Marichromatium bheemlicum]
MSASADPARLPVLAHARQRLAALLAAAEPPSRQHLAAVLLDDPALALQVLQRANAVPHRHFRAEVTTLEDAVHMLGTSEIAALVERAVEAERTLTGERLRAYRHASARAALAGALAADWAASDRDMFPAEVAAAALLHNLGELFLLAVGDRRIGRYLQLVYLHHVLPHEADYVALSDSLGSLGHRLACQWCLPEMVRETMRPHNATYQRALGVMLATQVARDACSGWQHPLLGRDLWLASEQLGLSPESLATRVNRVIIQVLGRLPVLAETALTTLPSPAAAPAVWGLRAPYRAPFCLAPRADELALCRCRLEQADAEDDSHLIATLLRGLHRGLGLNRVAFFACDPREQRLRPRLFVGSEFEPGFNQGGGQQRVQVLLEGLLEAPGVVRVGEGGAWPLPDALAEWLGVGAFLVMPLRRRMVTLGLVYGDRRSACCALDRQVESGFAAMVTATAAALARQSLDLSRTHRPPGRPKSP